MAHPLRKLTITVGSPPQLNGREGRLELADFYGRVLGMQVVSDGWLQIAKERGHPFTLALDGDGWSDDRPPRWPDPEYPQQMHFDIAVPDLAAAGQLVEDEGATLLRDVDEYRVYADPAGHPFCLFEDGKDTTTEPRIAVVTFDCFSPRSLAGFYEGFLGVEGNPRRADDGDRVVISLDDDRFPDFAFQHAQFVACRWPDPAYPAQLHVDYRFDSGKDEAVERVERLGAIRLPKLADTEIYADPAGHPFCI